MEAFRDVYKQLEKIVRSIEAGKDIGFGLDLDVKIMIKISVSDIIIVEKFLKDVPLTYLKLHFDKEKYLEQMYTAFRECELRTSVQVGREIPFFLNALLNNGVVLEV